MNLAITHSRANIGIDAPLITVETHISNGLPGLHMVGLPETAVKESKDRVRSAILNSYFDFPSRHITINLAPADLPKYGSRYDLAIAIGILAASKQLPNTGLANYEFAAELALSGALKPIQGILPLVMACRLAQKTLIIAEENINEAELITDASLLPAKTLLEVCGHFLNRSILIPHVCAKFTPTSVISTDLRQVKGQQHAKRALEIAASGQHSVLLIGPPGVGKTMLSNCLPGLLPTISESEAAELAAIQSIAGIKVSTDTWRQRPFRSPHHSTSAAALIGGSSPPQPGEISLAHQGVLFLDELPEFNRQTLEALREPLESGFIAISRARAKVRYPARFQLISAMNPCPCGHYGSAHNECTCTILSVKRYLQRISGPLLDRIDIQLELQLVTSSLLNKTNAPTEGSVEVASRVKAAREIALQRANKPNALLSNEEVAQFCQLTTQDKQWFEAFLEQKKCSSRSYQKILKVALTIADLEQSSSLQSAHLKEAFSYRFFDKLKVSY